MSSQPTLRVHVEYDGSKLDVEGSPDDVIKALLEFVSKVYPTYEIVRGLTLTVDLERLLKDLTGVVAFTPEGAVTLIQRDKLGRLSIRELIALYLSKAHVASQLKKADKASLSVDELLTAIGGRIGAMAGRLSEMVDEGLVERVGRGEYRITTYGLKHFQDTVLPKVRQLGGESK